MLQRTLPAGFIAPCLPSKTEKLPSGREWLHEIKHDGFRVIARKQGAQVRLYSRPGNDLTYHFPLIVETLARLRSRSCIIHGEAVFRQVPIAALSSTLPQYILYPAIGDEPNHRDDDVDRNRQPGTEKSQRNSGCVKYR
jgi:ATP dependent DNA ligase-like protein